MKGRCIKMRVKRIKIFALLRAGRIKSDIAKRLNVSRMIVHRVAEMLKNRKDLKDRSRSGRLQVASRLSVRKAFESASKLKMTALVKENISVALVSSAVKEEGGKILRCVERPLLTYCMRGQRRDRCRGLINDLKRHDNQIRIFSDEETFTVDPVINRKNERVVIFGQDVYDVAPCLRADARRRSLEW